MNTTGFIKAAVGAIVVALVAVSVILPIMATAAETEKTFTNDGYYRMSETHEETVFVWDTANDPYTLTVNGTEYDLSSMGFTLNQSYSIAFGEDFVLRYFALGDNSNIQIWKGAMAGASGVNQTSGIVATYTITSEGITVEKNDGGTVTTATVEHSGDYFTIDNDGAYVMKYANENAYVLQSSTIFYGCGISNVYTSTPSTLYLEGTADDYTVTPMKSGVTVSNESSTYSEVDGYVDLLSLEKLTFTTTYTVDDIEQSINQTYSYFLVPYEVTAEISNHPIGAALTIIQILPVLILVGVLTMIVNAFISNRRA